MSDLTDSERLELEAAAARIIAKAREHAEQSSSCSLRPTELVPFGERVLGWSFLMDVYKHDNVEHWGFSAKLVPPGRGSTEKDWSMLGAMIALVSTGSGYPDSMDMPDPITPIETTHPNATLHWMWHSDGSEIAPELTAMMAEVLNAVTPRDPQAPWPTGEPKPGRNDPCPCGSGRKYKKCCGASS